MVRVLKDGSKVMIEKANISPINSQKNETAKIFISIASYCDNLLKATIEDAFAKATYPDRLRFGVVEQTDLDQRLPLANMTRSKQIRYIAIDRLHSRGVGWARNVAMSLYQEEDWFFQIDSHMIFKLGWDIKILESAEECSKVNPQFVISSYPNPFNFIDGIPTPQPVTEKILAHVVKGDSDFGEFLTLGFKAISIDQEVPLKGYHLGAGCLFAPGKFASKFPYDPQIYFEGEEQALAARLFTHGWDIFHVPGLPIYHLYQKADAPTRPKHWNKEDDVNRTEKWHELSSNAKHRLTSILLEENNYGVYGLGQQRTMEEYAAFSGIDYRKKEISQVAKTGPWSKVNQDHSYTKDPNSMINLVEINKKSSEQESVSGPGSTLAATSLLLKNLRGALNNLSIRSLVDAPCGDLNWMKYLEYDLDLYIGIDIVPELIKKLRADPILLARHFQLNNIVTDVLPSADAIFCRDFFVHLPFIMINNAIEMWRIAGFKYAMVTTFPDHAENTDCQIGSWRALNFCAAPFNWPEPILIVSEFPDDMDWEYRDKSIGIWDLENIPNTSHGNK